MLIITPKLGLLGGVSNHFSGLAPHWTINVDYLVYGKRYDKMHSILVIFLYLYDYLHFLWKCLFGHYDIILINPSLRKAQILRDGIFIFTANVIRKKIVVMFHGFDEKLAISLKNNLLFRYVYNMPIFIYVLYSGFQEILQSIGIKVPILLTTTKVSDELVTHNLRDKRSNIQNILFVARIVKSKGIYTAIDVYALLKQKYPFLNFTICGDGSEMQKAKGYVEELRLSDVYFAGNIKGNAIADYYSRGDLYLLPTHFEGMATTVLEAMAFGLPVITRPVGGVKDFFVNGEMGFLVDSLRAEDYANVIEKLIQNPSLVTNMSATNRIYALDHFVASSVCRKMENDLKKYVKTN